MNEADLRHRLAIDILEHFLLMKCPHCGQTIPDELIVKQVKWIERRKQMLGEVK